MKQLFGFLAAVMFFFSFSAKAQSASDYFPVNDSDHIWNYKITTLDTLGEPVESSTYFEKDSLANFGNYFDKEAYLVLSKNGSASSIQFQPYLDSSFINLDNSIGNIYFGNILAPYVGGLLETGLNDYAGWYPIYDFTAPPLQTVELFRLDTTITIDSVTIPARLTIERRRLQDELIETELGLFTAKKFELSFNIYYVTIIPLKIISIPTDFWIAEGNWLVKERRESEWISYPDLGIPPIFIPGSEKIIVENITSVDEITSVPTGFNLSQNYPNPFSKTSGANPTTVISYSIPQKELVTIKIYDAAGKEIETLVNKEISSGVHNVRWNASQLSSGIYFYRMRAGDFVATKKMILLK